jgi:hypothetical protein
MVEHIARKKLCEKIYTNDDWQAFASVLEKLTSIQNIDVIFQTPRLLTARMIAQKVQKQMQIVSWVSPNRRSRDAGKCQDIRQKHIHDPAKPHRKLPPPTLVTPHIIPLQTTYIARDYESLTVPHTNPIRGKQPSSLTIQWLSSARCSTPLARCS